MATAWPKLPEVRAYLRMQPDPAEDAVIDQARAAAIDYGVRKLGQTTITNPDGTISITWTYPPDTTTLPSLAFDACVKHAARHYRRRDSMDGTIAWGEGILRVGGADPDVERAYAALGPMVFG